MYKIVFFSVNMYEIVFTQPVEFWQSYFELLEAFSPLSAALNSLSAESAEGGVHQLSCVQFFYNKLRLLLVSLS